MITSGASLFHGIHISNERAVNAALSRLWALCSYAAARLAEPPIHASLSISDGTSGNAGRSSYRLNRDNRSRSRLSCEGAMFGGLVYIPIIIRVNIKRNKDGRYDD